MKRLLLIGLFATINAQVALAQVGGGAAGFAGNAAGTRSVYGNDYGGNPAQMERSKRQTFAYDATATFIEASILMNVKADEFVAVFGVTTEGKTPQEAGVKIEATIGSFKEALKPLGITDADLFVDFVVQNRVYAYRIEETLVKEELTGFELKKNVSIHFKDKMLVDKFVVAAASAQIFDLIKVDYVVKDMAAIQAQLQTSTANLIKSKVDRYQKLLGAKLPAPVQIVADRPSVYYPVEQYDTYTAAESENITPRYNNNSDRFVVQNARKSRTTYFNPLSGNGFDIVINPVIIEPVVQFTTYLKVKYEAPKNRKR